MRVSNPIRELLGKASHNPTISILSSPVVFAHFKLTTLCTVSLNAAHFFDVGYLLYLFKTVLNLNVSVFCNPPPP